MEHGWSIRRSRSGKIAAERLRQMKIAERTDCSAEELEQMKADLTAVISKYIDIGKRDVHLYLRRGKRSAILVAAVSLPGVQGDETAEIMKQSS